MKTWIKYCGFTRRADALSAVKIGVNAIGLVFYPPSPRAVSITQAQAITQELPGSVETVALFVNEQAETIRNILQQVPIDLLQFHGDETPADCEQFGKPYLKAVRMVDDIDLHALCQHFKAAQGLLLDAFQAGTPGGTGVTFDWSRIPQDLSLPIIIAGGLTPENVGQVIEQAKPYGVDVSGGIESAKGIKDLGKMEQFMLKAQSGHQ